MTNPPGGDPRRIQIRSWECSASCSHGQASTIDVSCCDMSIEQAEFTVIAPGTPVFGFPLPHQLDPFGARQLGKVLRALRRRSDARAGDLISPRNSGHAPGRLTAPLALTLLHPERASDRGQKA